MGQTLELSWALPVPATVPQVLHLNLVTYRNISPYPTPCTAARHRQPQAMAPKDIREHCSERDRFILDLEFVQCLANAEYVVVLACWLFACGRERDRLMWTPSWQCLW
jgi:hypothetical protein